jgi:hypothetical protein
MAGIQGRRQDGKKDRMRVILPSLFLPAFAVSTFHPSQPWISASLPLRLPALCNV